MYNTYVQKTSAPIPCHSIPSYYEITHTRTHHKASIFSLLLEHQRWCGGNEEEEEEEENSEWWARRQLAHNTKAKEH